jgi:hypothetical protein
MALVPGGRGEADEAACGASHLTLPGPAGQARGLAAHVAPGPLPLPPKGGEGLFPVNSRLCDTARVQSVLVPRTALLRPGSNGQVG